MALSEREQQLLNEMEAQLQSEDPSLASSMQEPAVGKLNVRNLVLGVLGTVVGIVILLVGIYQQLIPVGVIGFLIMGGGVYLATTIGNGSSEGTDRRGGGGGSGGSGGSGPRNSAPSPSGSFMNNLEQKWDERRQQG